MNQKKVLLCEDTLEGIFTAVYDGWHYGKSCDVEIRTEMPENLELFCEYESITSDREKSQKVAGSILRKLGIEVYEAVCHASLSTHPEKGTAVFHVIWQALSGGKCNRGIMNALADPYVNLVSKLHTKVGHECHRFTGFIRFHEVGGGVLFSKINPENDILLMLAPHFENRFPNENWMIYDERREKVLLHRKREACTVQEGVRLLPKHQEALSQTEEYEQLWKAFCQSITIQERKNPKLQQQFLPKKFRPNMLEFQ